jgi:chromate transport protein ChrA
MLLADGEAAARALAALPLDRTIDAALVFYSALSLMFVGWMVQRQSRFGWAMAAACAALAGAFVFIATVQLVGHWPGSTDVLRGVRIVRAVALPVVNVELIRLVIRQRRQRRAGRIASE